MNASSQAIVAVKREVQLSEWQRQVQERQEQGIPVDEWCASLGISKGAYYISMPALDRKIQRRVRRDGSEGAEYINNVVIRPSLYRTYGIPDETDVIFIGDITFGSVIAFTVKGIELIDSGVAKLGEYRVNCTAACAFTTKTFPDRSGRQITVPDYGTRETHDAVLTHDFIDRLCEEVYPVSDPVSVRKTIDRWKEYIEFRKYYLGVQSEKCEEIADVSVKEAYVVTEAEATKRIAPAPTVVKHVVKKNFGISGGGNVAEKHSILPRKCKK